MASEAELRLRDRLSKLKSIGLLGGTKVSGELERLQRQLDRITAEPSEDEIWRSVELARHQDRPYTLDYVDRLLDDWVELHGDRGRADDAAIVSGLGKLDDRTIVLVGHQKGRDVKERTKRNFGMAYPEGYRKAMRVMKLADRFGFPIVTLVDTPGAYPGVAAEQHGQGGAIASSQATMLRLGVPIVSVVIGEGGSGGAIAIAVGDRVLMQENAIYSVISPEGCAAILWRDASEAKKAAAAFKPDAAHCLELGVIDGIVPEPSGGAHTDPDEAARLLGGSLREALDELDELPVDELSRRRRGPGSVPSAFLPRTEASQTALPQCPQCFPRPFYDSRPGKPGLECGPPLGEKLSDWLLAVGARNQSPRFSPCCERGDGAVSPRSIRRGPISLGLVGVPVPTTTATASKVLRFHILHKHARKPARRAKSKRAAAH